MLEEVKRTYLVSVLAVAIFPVPADLRLAHALELLTLAGMLHLQVHLTAVEAGADIRAWGEGHPEVAHRARALWVKLLALQCGGSTRHSCFERLGTSFEDLILTGACLRI